MKLMGWRGAIVGGLLGLVAWSGAASAQGAGCDVVVTCEAPGLERSNTWETLGFVGLQWNFGDQVPELVLGLRRSETRLDDRVIGGKLDIAVPLDFKAFTLPTVRLMGLGGNRDVQGEIGIGLQLKDMKPLIGAGVQGPFVNGGANFVWGDKAKLYVGGNSLRRPAAAKTGGQTCQAGYTLVDAAPIFNSEAYAVDGKVCRGPQLVN